MRIRITGLGAPLVNRAEVLASGDTVAAIAVELKSKYCTASAISHTDDDRMLPGIILMSTEESLKLSPDSDGFTIVVFPEYEGWTVHSVSYGGYAVHVCLVRGNTQVLLGILT